MFPKNVSSFLCRALPSPRSCATNELALSKCRILCLHVCNNLLYAHKTKKILEHSSIVGVAIHWCLTMQPRATPTFQLKTVEGTIKRVRSSSLTSSLPRTSAYLLRLAASWYFCCVHAILASTICVSRFTDSHLFALVCERCGGGNGVIIGNLCLSLLPKYWHQSFL